MIFLVLSIISSTLIFVIFRLLSRLRHPFLPVIVINYFFAFLAGVVLSPAGNKISALVGADWAGMSVVIGVLFILMFFVVGKSSEKAKK
jgi:hypothetical protein